MNSVAKNPTQQPNHAVIICHPGYVSEDNAKYIADCFDLEVIERINDDMSFTPKDVKDAMHDYGNALFIESPSRAATSRLAFPHNVGIMTLDEALARCLPENPKNQPLNQCEAFVTLWNNQFLATRTVDLISTVRTHKVEDENSERSHIGYSFFIKVNWDNMPGFMYQSNSYAECCEMRNNLLRQLGVNVAAIVYQEPEPA
jgi:hypothetical protein